MKKILGIGFIMVAVLMTAGCKKKNLKTAQENLEGKWTVTSTEVLGSVVPGDGSYLQFYACSGSCNGVDHKVSDTTSGTFSYSLNDEATVLTITDNSTDGGSWGASWDLLELTETDLRMTASTAFGNVKVEFKK